MTTPIAVEPIPILHLESMDGSVVIRLDNTTGWIRMPGSTGLEMAPVEIIASPTPGVAGSTLEDVRVQARPVFLPIYCRSATGQRSHLQMLDQLRSLVNPLGNRTFKIVGSSVRGVRELVVTYESGLEGSDGADERGLSWCKVGLKLTAHSPFAQAREPRTIAFHTATSTPTPFLGAAGGSDAPFPTRMLSSTTIIGEGMEVLVDSEVPVYPTLELVGAMDSFSGNLSPTVIRPDGTVTTITDQAWSVNVPLGVPGGSTLRLVTDPRSRSIRLDGNLAAGRVARGSALRPFYPGTNVLDVAAPGSTSGTRILLSWTDLYWSIW